MGQKIPHWLHVIWLSDTDMVMNFVGLEVSVMDHLQLILWVVSLSNTM